MKYSFTSFLFAASTLLSATVAQYTPPQDDCDNENFISSPVSGAPWSKGDGNTYFCDTRWNSGLVICGIQTWAWKFHQRGFKVKYSDGTWGPMHGTQMQEDEKDNWTGDYSKNTVEWDCSQPLKDLRMISHWPGYSIYRDEWLPDAVGGIRLTTPDGRDFYIHGDIGKFPGESFDLGTGYLVGARGRSGGFVDTLEWRLLASPVASAEIKNMQFTQDLDTLNARSDKVAETTFANIWFTNRDSEGERKFSLSDQRAESVSTAITHSTQHQFGVKLELAVEAQIGVPLLSSAKVSSRFETSYQLQKTNSDTLTTTREQRMTWMTEGQVKVKSAMHCKAWAFMGRYDDDYVADVEITFRNGKKIVVRQPGKYVSVGWTQAVLDCQTKPLSEAPIDATDLTAPNSTVKMLRGRAIGARLW